MLQISEKDRDEIKAVIGNGIYPNLQYATVNNAVLVLERLKPILAPETDKKQKKK